MSAGLAPRRRTRGQDVEGRRGLDLGAEAQDPFRARVRGGQRSGHGAGRPAPGRMVERPCRSLDPARRIRPELRRALEALGLAVVLAFLPELVRARTGVVIEPHPAWIAVLVLAARDGSGGFFMGLIATAIAVTAATAFTGSSLAVSWSRLDSGPNLIAFGACLTVSWFASWHVRRQEDLRERLRTLSDRVRRSRRDHRRPSRRGRDPASASRSHVGFAVLPARRRVAPGGKDPVAAAEAAVDLALARTGAGAAAIKVGMGRFQRLLAVRDARGPRRSHLWRFATPTSRCRSAT